MKVRNLISASLAVLFCLMMQSASSAQIFFTEGFDYENGDLSAVSGGLWVNHSGAPPAIQVLDGQAVITAPGGDDENRQTGSVMDVNDVWYYALTFSVELGGAMSINPDYFIHFKDEGTFNFSARLALQPPANIENDFSLAVFASSEGDGQADWNGDFSFGESITAVMRWDNGTGAATLWVNPANMASTNVTDTEEPDSMLAFESVALRQDNSPTGSSSVVSIDILSAGTDFNAVLDAVSGGGTGCTNPLGDINGDGVVSLLDVNPFVALLTGGGFQCEADVNEDGVVSLLDVNPFVALLSGG